MKVRFICGCMSADLIEIDDVHVKNGVKWDRDGFIVCARHDWRRYGWMSVPYRATELLIPEMATWSALEYERYLIFGILPDNAKVEFKITNLTDRRDNRDPQEVGLQALKNLADSP